jgi:molybdopterin-containing oxidoreductase family iron-sulfur binding subunit
LQVYNRCIGTRFCSNNCPYKVRRFNFLQYADEDTESLKAQRNPEVTVRMRGVMEKCTYCVQRITNARIEAEKGNRRLVDGEVVTACQAVCPTSAIVFGDLNDPSSQVRQVKASALDYALLSELNTRPRTTYLAKLSNPNPELSDTPAADAKGDS